MIEAKDLEVLLDQYVEASKSQSPVEAARCFIEGVMEPVLREQRKADWVEMTPSNAMWGGWLQEAFPDMALVHVVRDGRDVAVSVTKTWKHLEVPEALEWWQRRIEHIAIECEKMAPGSLHTVSLERLARDDRDRSYQELLEFLNVEDAPQMRDFFQTRLIPERSNIERWKRDLEPAAQEQLAQQYDEILGTLRKKGIEWCKLIDQT